MEAKSCLQNAQQCIYTAQQCDDAGRQAAYFDLARVWLELGIAYEKRRGQAWLAVERKRGCERAIAVRSEHTSLTTTSR